MKKLSRKILCEKLASGQNINDMVQYLLEKMWGWLVPEQLRDNWTCHLGDSKKLLPKLLSELSNIDVFIHDSRHMYRHMSFEYKVSWNYLNKGGLLCSHDVLQNNAFDDFVKEYNVRECIKIGNFGGVYKI